MFCYSFSVTFCWFSKLFVKCFLLRVPGQFHILRIRVSDPFTSTFGVTLSWGIVWWENPRFYSVLSFTLTFTHLPLRSHDKTVVNDLPSTCLRYWVGR